MVDFFAQVCGERGVGISKSSLKTLVQDLLLVICITLATNSESIDVSDTPNPYTMYSCLRMCQRVIRKQASLMMLLTTAGREVVSLWNNVITMSYNSISFCQNYLYL